MDGLEGESSNHVTPIDQPEPDLLLLAYDELPIMPRLAAYYVHEG